MKSLFYIFFLICGIGGIANASPESDVIDNFCRAGCNVYCSNISSPNDPKICGDAQVKGTLAKGNAALIGVRSLTCDPSSYTCKSKCSAFNCGQCPPNTFMTRDPNTCKCTCGKPVDVIIPR